MADDRAPKPAPRPRRRRTDIDPNAPTPPVANERRRRKKPVAGEGASTPGLDAASAAAAEAASILPDAPTSSTARPISDTQPFHVPRIDPTPAEAGGTAAAVAASSARGVGAGGSTTGGRARVSSGTTVEPDTAPTGGPDSASTSGPDSAPTGGPDSASTSETGRAWLNRLEDRSLDPNICPFLRSSVDGRLASPIESPDPTNRCAALSEAVPQSLRQQELVCLSSGHVNCPRYLRGAATATETPVPVIRARRTLTTPIFVSLVILVMTISASAAFVMARGGLVLSGDLASPSVAAVGGSASPSVIASASVEPSASSSASASPSIAPSATPSASPSVTPEPTASATPTSDRYKLLKACPNTPNCWIYTVRSGDNVFSIAHYFGVSTDSIYARNPWLKHTGLRAGQQLRLPPPTR